MAQNVFDKGGRDKDPVIFILLALEAGSVNKFLSFT